MNIPGSNPTHPPYRLWRINATHYSLQAVGKEIFMEPRLLKLLAFLQDHAGKVLSREEIASHVWDEVIVSDESLSKAVFDLRKFLQGNFSDCPRITTIRKVGYQFIPHVHIRTSPQRRILRIFAKVAGYTLIAFAITVLLVRAIRY